MTSVALDASAYFEWTLTGAGEKKTGRSRFRLFFDRINRINGIKLIFNHRSHRLGTDSLLSHPRGQGLRANLLLAALPIAKIPRSVLAMIFFQALLTFLPRSQPMIGIRRRRGGYAGQAGSAELTASGQIS